MKKLLAIGAWGLFGWLAWALWSLPAGQPGLTAESLAQLPASGVENPVTAVLLNYRGYDTLLEVAVLLLALVGVWSLAGANLGALEQKPPALLAMLVRVVLPLLVVAAGYLLWIGAFAPGGAFQGGALLGGGIVLGALAGLGARLLRHEGWLRTGLVIGLVVFAGVTGGTLWATGGLLQYPAGTGGTWIMVIESAGMVSIGLTLGLMFIGGRPVREER